MKTKNTNPGSTTIRLFLTLLTVAFLIFSCQQDEQESILTPVVTTNSDKLKLEFGKSLTTALANEPLIRSFLKKEAMKMMNGDFDILYALVKNERLGNNKTLEQTLSGYFGGIEKLRKIEEGLPLLTIFIPTLPENSFSAEKWNPETEVPFVAISLKTSNDVPIISPEGEEYILDADLIPSYPVVVVKDNERMMYKGQPGYDQLKSTRVLTNSEGVNYKFVSDIFDSYIQVKNQESLRGIPSIDQKLVDAYYIYQGADGWQRDYIYYGISPSNPNGQLSYDFVEYIRSFDIVGDDWAVFNGMTRTNQDPTDPQIRYGKRTTGWTEGNFEIKAITLIQSRNGLGPDIPSPYVSNGANLFNVTYRSETRGNWPFRYTYYIINSVTAIPQLTNFNIVNWDLNNYAASFRIDMEEVDDPTEVTEQITVTTKFATNFGIEATIFKKIGLKFGSSLAQDVTTTLTKKTTLGSFQMGSVVVNFADNVVTSPWYSREYSNNIFSISVEPKRVQ